MKRLIALVVVLLLAFYVAWPGWTAYRIATAVKAKDAETLDRKIDFPSVRVTLRPAAEQKIGEIYDKFRQQLGPAGQIVAGQLKGELPKVADTVLGTLVNSGNLIRVVTEGGTLKQNAEKILQEQVGKIGLPGGAGAGGPGTGGGQLGGIKLPGGLGQIAGQLGGKFGLPGLGGSPNPVTDISSAPAPAATPTAPEGYGLGNIKKFGFLGPFGFEIGVAKDKAATEPDVIAELRFVGGDWRVTGVRPKF